jgi:hypothetical protein
MGKFKTFLEDYRPRRSKYAKWTDINGKPLPMNRHKLNDYLTQDSYIRRTKDGEEYHTPFIPTDGLLTKADLQNIGDEVFYKYLNDEQIEQVNQHWLENYGVTYEVDYPPSSLGYELEDRI